MKRLIRIHFRKLVVLLGILVCLVLALKFDGLSFLSDLLTINR